jgi:hypothetical protein
MPILQDSQPLLHRNFVSVLTAQSPIPNVEPAAFASAVSPARIREFGKSKVSGRGFWRIGPARAMAEAKSVHGLKQKNASVIDVMSLFGHSHATSSFFSINYFLFLYLLIVPKRWGLSCG